MEKLTRNQKIFCDEYLIDLNATRAYKIAYPNVKKDETAAAAGARLLRNVNVQNYIDRKMKEREKRTEITQDKVLKELAKVAFANAADYARVVEKEYIEEIKDDEGNIVGQETRTYKAVEIEPTNNLDKDKQAAIAGIKHGTAGIEIKLNDKIKALELIGRHLGMFNDKVEVNGKLNTGTEKLDSILKQLKEDWYYGRRITIIR